MSEPTLRGETILEALRARRSIGALKPDLVPRRLVERVIEAATWAPNHHLTQPWRFVVVAGGARDALGEIMASSLLARLEQPGDERAAGLLQKERAKPLRAPVLIAVAAVPSPDPAVVEMEELAAVAAGVQNMLLAAEALGMGAMWRTRVRSGGEALPGITRCGAAAGLRLPWLSAVLARTRAYG